MPPIIGYMLCKLCHFKQIVKFRSYAHFFCSRILTRPTVSGIGVLFYASAVDIRTACSDGIYISLKLIKHITAHYFGIIFRINPVKNVLVSINKHDVLLPDTLN